MATYFSESELRTYGTVDLWCDECGHRITGEPYQTSFCGICVCFDPVDFCSKECWEASEMYNTENWPDPPKAPEGW